MAETVKCTCSECGAKYRLPVEAQGRTARCKRCGEKFKVPRGQNLEDTVISWLGGDEEDDLDQVSQPRVISMPHDDEEEEVSDAVRRMRGPIRLKDGSEKKAEAESG